MARRREFDPELALEQAMELFWQKGYDETSMEDLVHATGVSRYGFYSAFGDKRSLYEAAFNRYRERELRARFAPLFEPDAALPQVKAFFQGLRDKGAAGDERGCLISNTAAQLSPTDDAFRCLTQQVFDQVGDLFRDALTRAVAKGQLPSDYDVDRSCNLMSGATFLLPFLLHAGLGFERVLGVMAAVEQTVLSG